jgi:hypothetical protein
MAVAVVGTPSVIQATGSGTYSVEAGSNRVVVGIACGNGGASTRPVGSAVFGGQTNSGTVLGATVSPADANGQIIIGVLYWTEAKIALLTNGGVNDTVDVTFTGGDPASGSRIIMLTLSGVDQTTPSDASTSNSAANVTSGAGLGMSLTTAANGLVIAGHAHHGTFGVTYSTATEASDAGYTTFRAGYGVYTPGSTSYSETIFPAATYNMAITAVSFQAAAGGTTRGQPFGMRGTAFNGGRVFFGPIN